jgi:hypothetical protein
MFFDFGRIHSKMPLVCLGSNIVDMFVSHVILLEKWDDTKGYNQKP